MWLSDTQRNTNLGFIYVDNENVLLLCTEKRKTVDWFIVQEVWKEENKQRRKAAEWSKWIMDEHKENHILN